jgi:predicted transcriptional regulator
LVPLLFLDSKKLSSLSSFAENAMASILSLNFPSSTKRAHNIIQDAASESNEVVVADENEKKNSIKITKKGSKQL